MYSLKQISNIINGTILGSDSTYIKYLSIDSRKIFFPQETLFFAIITDHRDGHNFIQDAYEQGVKNFIITKPINFSIYADACFITVGNSITALQQLATHHRQQFKIPVIGISGSNGKTIVKEWLNQLLEPDFNICRSPKSYNSQVGVPLSIWQLNKHNQLGIFEAGISKPDEMDTLEKVISPTIGILTNIGSAHDEGFKNREQKLSEKLKLFKQGQTLICCFDDELVNKVVTQNSIKTFSWGKTNGCDVSIVHIEKQSDGTYIDLEYNKERISFKLFFSDEASVENALHCFCTCILLGLKKEIIVERIQKLRSIEMRLEWKKAINNCYLIDDSYNNDLSSLTIALDYLQQQSQTVKKTVILTDIFQSGISDTELYNHVADLLSQRKIGRLISIGNTIILYKHFFIDRGIEVITFNTTENFLQAFESLSFKDETILLKGARAFELERVAHILEQQAHHTILETNLSALTDNLKKYRSLLKPGTKIMVMVKAFGYGSGGAEIAKVLQFNKVDYLAVAYVDEGVSLRRAGIHLPIMVMNPEPSAFNLMDEHNLEPEIFSFEILNAFIHYCKSKAIKEFPIHIKFDTGMHRLGFEFNELDALIKSLLLYEELKVKSVFSHLAVSDDPTHNSYTHQQAELFTSICNTLEEKISYPFIRHISNTAAISRHPHLQLDMVRLGIGIYGVDTANQLSLRVVTMLKSTIAQIRFVKAGETVGYSRKGIVIKDSLIATVRIGYADGFRRQLSNGKGYMYLHGQLAPVIGNVCMDMTMIDVTHIKNVQVGDEVEIFGKHIHIEKVAELCNTIPYEIMTGINQRVKRIFFEE